MTPDEFMQLYLDSTNSLRELLGEELLTAERAGRWFGRCYDILPVRGDGI
jgi:hypothetical protein